MNLAKAQIKMKFYSDQHRSNITFEVGDWVYLKLQPYRQLSTKRTKDHKLSKKIYIPFQILERIGPVAHKLGLPPSSKIHPVFQILLLKLHKGEILLTEISTFPSTFMDNHPI